MFNKIFKNTFDALMNTS